MHEMYTYEINV